MSSEPKRSGARRSGDAVGLGCGTGPGGSFEDAGDVAEALDGLDGDEAGAGLVADGIEGAVVEPAVDRLGVEVEALGGAGGAEEVVDAVGAVDGGGDEAAE